MQQLTTEPARPLDTDGMPWIPTGPGKSFRPLRFTADGWPELMRLEAGSVVALHRHTGELHAFNIAGTVDTWGATADGPCVIHLKVTGAIEYLGPDGQVTETVSAASQRAIYLDWCQREGVTPNPGILG
jgi:2,4'-dihydroxyacetophenone dioxygenase